ncbi:PREDICTED: transmembrane protein 170B-like [Acropora digitifera]|uniref:transmembrane protein 170B-like n=1 Tax=Acropora digitifera TaxID=70779 RepID=UPI00077A8C01|nr:PREDICTED: transmembrane protein 170B-like [Acropora digitifera]
MCREQSVVLELVRVVSCMIFSLTWTELDHVLRRISYKVLMDVQENLKSFGEMWYQIFLWCLATSVFIHCVSACVAFLALRKHSRGVFFPLLVVFIGFLYPVTGGVITSATIASVYETARFTMPRYASFLWGAGQAFIGFLVSYTRVLATL